MPPDKITARFQTRLAEQAIRCELCPRHCVIRPGSRGFCGHRANEDGALIAAEYGRVAALGIDPIEKKPLYHFHPGAVILSAGANGCNLACKFCQNWHLSGGHARADFLAPASLAPRGAAGGSIGVAFTYNEPTIWFEYILDNARLLREQGLAVVLVTNGYLEPEPWDELCQWVDAMNVDVKGDDEFYRGLTGGRLAPVRRNVEAAHRAGVHIEVTNLLVTGANDRPEQIGEMVEWLADLSTDIPLHLSRYFPQHEWTAPATPTDTMLAAWELARSRLPFVYVGNISFFGSVDTVCPASDRPVIKRLGYRVDRLALTRANTCSHCGAHLPIVS